ncbi:MAG TPA: hypothetical protein VMS17_23320 [Gemmataceae bacterium]|nr:hypothetical protein [Gemmataceae bacterium]
MGNTWIRVVATAACLSLLALLGVLWWLFWEGGFAYFLTGPTYMADVGTNGIQYELPGPCLDYRPHDTAFYWRTVHWTLKVDQQHHIWLNGVSYGQLSRGDKLRMEWDGSMLVDGELREPASRTAGQPQAP